MAKQKTSPKFDNAPQREIVETVITSEFKDAASEPEADIEEYVEPVDEVKYSNKFWNGTVYLKEVGAVHGRAKLSDIELFKAAIPKNVKLSDWLVDSDVHAEWMAKHTRKNRSL